MMEKVKRSCENCGNGSCKSTPVAIYYNDCIKTNYEVFWTPKPFLTKSECEQKPTNADRIRSMTDEELAEFMCHNVSNGTVNCAFCSAEEFCRMGHNGWLDWLKQEAK